MFRLCNGLIMRYILLLCLLLITGCTHTQVVYKYRAPEIPSALLVCEQLDEPTITTNGNLLMAYITVRSQYQVCASKVKAISDIISTANEDDNDNRASN